MGGEAAGSSQQCGKVAKYQQHNYMADADVYFSTCPMALWPPCTPDVFQKAAQHSSNVHHTQVSVCISWRGKLINHIDHQPTIALLSVHTSIVPLRKLSIL